MVHKRVVNLASIADQYREVQIAAAAHLESKPDRRDETKNILTGHESRLYSMLRTWLTKEGLL